MTTGRAGTIIKLTAKVRRYAAPKKAPVAAPEAQAEALAAQPLPEEPLPAGKAAADENAAPLADKKE